MEILKISELNLLDRNAVMAYEKSLYQAFKSRHPDVFKNLWIFDHAQQRARTLVPYEGQRILIAEADQTFIGAVALNLDMNTQLQLEKYGFSIPKHQGKSAEALLMFSQKIMVGRHLVLSRLAEACHHLLQSLAISVLWGSCEKRHLLGYRQLGFRTLTKVRFNGQDEFLLQRVLSV